MGFVSSLLGTAGGVNGTGVSGPGAASIASPVTTQQANLANDASNAAIQQQNAFAQAVAAQNGLGNQSNVYNQLQGVVEGTGPNAAQAMLNNSTGQNVANQAALMASQRGASANPALIARQAAMQGANTQQQAVGQGAALQAQQSQNALNSMGNIAGQQVTNQANATGAATQAAQNQQQNLLNAIGNQNQANVASQGSINQANAGIAGSTMAGQKDLFGSLTGAGGAVIGKFFAGGGQVPMQHYANGTPQGGVVIPGSGQYVQQMPAVDPFAPVAGPAVMPAPAPMVMPAAMPMQQAAMMPVAAPVEVVAKPVEAKGPKSSVGKIIAEALQPKKPEAGGEQPSKLRQGMDQLLQGIGTAISRPAAPQSMMLPASNPVSQMETMLAAQGGKVPAMVSPGEQYLPPAKAKEVVKEGKNPLKEGKRIPGQPQYPGNDYRNDVVPAQLEEGGVVIPNSIMQSKDAAAKAKAFVEAVLAKGQHMPKKAKK